MTEAALQLIHEVTDAGGRLAIRGDKLHVSAPSSLPDELMGRLRLPDCRPLEPQSDWGSRDKAQKDRNRRKYHGLKAMSFQVINKLIGEALEKAAPPELVRVARRFRMRRRKTIYTAAATSDRALQLAETFPVLALAIYERPFYPPLDDDVLQRRNEASFLVDKGAPLKRVAATAGVLMALRAVKPGAADLALECCPIFTERPDLLHAYLPASQKGMKFWLPVLEFAGKYGPPFAEWAARNALAMGRDATVVCQLLWDIADWVKASYGVSAPDYDIRFPRGNNPPQENNIGAEYVTRPFTPDMSLKTVVALSEEWHEAVANNIRGDGNYQEFPPPWCDGGTVDGYQIEPVTNNADLYVEGRRMHHCVGTYANDVLKGTSKNSPFSGVVDLESG